MAGIIPTMTVMEISQRRLRGGLTLARTELIGRALGIQTETAGEGRIDQMLVIGAFCDSSLASRRRESGGANGWRETVVHVFDRACASLRSTLRPARSSSRIRWSPSC